MSILSVRTLWVAPGIILYACFSPVFRFSMTSKRMIEFSFFPSFKIAVRNIIVFLLLVFCILIFPTVRLNEYRKRKDKRVDFYLSVNRI